MRTFLAILAAATLLAACDSSSSRIGRIEEAGYIQVGGIEQWVTIRGEEASNPILLFVHGGPGDVQSPLISTYAPYEKDFVLVQWDQRGAGRTFQKLGEATPDLTLERLVADGIELAEHLRRRFPKNRLVLMGHSWGSVVAVGMARQRPELFAAYVGTGQVSRWADSVQFQFEFLKKAARDAGDAAMLAELEAIGRPDPKNVEQYFGFTRGLRKFMHPADRAWLAGLKELFLGLPGATEADLEWLGNGMSFSGRALIGATVEEDLFVTAPRLELPVYVIQGRYDLSTPTEPARAFFDALQAPEKRFVVLEEAGHFALVTHREAFVAELVDQRGAK
jgi:pimeloyl-ACP methyl ester carboxylesterase